MTKLRNSNCDKPQKLKLLQNWKKWNCDKTHTLKLWQNLNNQIVKKPSNCDKTQKLKLWPNSKPKILTKLNKKTQIVKKLKLWQNSNCDQIQRLKLWSNSKTKISPGCLLGKSDKQWKSLRVFWIFSSSLKSMGNQKGMHDSPWDTKGKVFRSQLKRLANQFGH